MRSRKQKATSVGRPTPSLRGCCYARCGAAMHTDRHASHCGPTFLTAGSSARRTDNMYRLLHANAFMCFLIVGTSAPETQSVLRQRGPPQA